MKIRSLALLGAAAASLVPVASHADSSHCEVPIYLFSTARVESGIDDPTTPESDQISRNGPGYATGALGCDDMRDTVFANDPAFEYLYNTDLITPGANRLSVRLLDNGTDPSIIESATMAFAGETYELDFRLGASLVQDVPVVGGEPDFLDSQNIMIDPTLTLEAHTATITICLNIPDLDCLVRVFRTVPAQPLPA